MSTEDHYASKTITVDFVPQVYPTPWSDHPIELEAIPFDATEWILAQDLSDIHDIINTGGDIDDDIVPMVVRDEHPGKPFHISNTDMAILEFFNVDHAEEITQEMLDQAKRAHHIGEEKIYRVDVDRIEVRRITVEVRATDREAATLSAEGIAYDTDFYGEGEVIDANYSCSDVRTKGLPQRCLNQALDLNLDLIILKQQTKEEAMTDTAKKLADEFAIKTAPYNALF